MDCFRTVGLLTTRLTVGAVAPLLIVLVACTDRYQLAQDKEGRTIRLDRQTGEVAILSDGRLVVAKNEQQQAAEDTEKRSRGTRLGRAQDVAGAGLQEHRGRNRNTVHDVAGGDSSISASTESDSQGIRPKLLSYTLDAEALGPSRVCCR